MSVDDTYCLDEVEDNFITKPLSFIEFVDLYEQKSTIFPHILDKIKEISNKPEKTDFYIRGYVGCGKSTFMNLLLAYRVYLFMSLKDPNKFFGLSSSSSTCISVFGSIGSVQLFEESFINTLKQIPSIFKSSISERPDIISYYVNESNGRLTISNSINSLFVVHISCGADLIGLNTMFSVFPSSAIDDAMSSGEDVFDLFLRAHDRWDSRANGGKGISTFIMDKRPNNFWSDRLDIYIEEQDRNRVNLEVVDFQWYWTRFPKSKWSKGFHYMDLSTGKVINTPNESSVFFPDSVDSLDLLKKAENYPEQFIQDFVGAPLWIGMKKDSLDAMKEIKDLMVKNHIVVNYVNGKLYLTNTKDKSELRIDSIFN